MPKVLLFTLISCFSLWTALTVQAQSDGSEYNGADGRAYIPFAAMGGIRSFRVLDDRTLLVEGTNRQWYRADLFGTCFGLRGSEAIGFVTGHDGHLDRFSSILVAGDRCYFRSFVEVDAPAPRLSERPGGG